MQTLTVRTGWTWLKSKITLYRLVWLLLLAFVVHIALERWKGTQRPPAELTYCAQYAFSRQEDEPCKEAITLRIPRIYYAGYPLEGPHKSIDHYQHLEVAYPSMQPWYSVPWLERWNTHKVEIKIDGFYHRTPQELFRSYVASYPELTHASEPLHGLDNYFQEKSWIGQLLLSLEPYPRVFMTCGYRKGDPKDDEGLGCTARTLLSLTSSQKDVLASDKPWGMRVIYYHRRILLPQWSDLHSRVQALVRSFVVTP